MAGKKKIKGHCAKRRGGTTNNSQVLSLCDYDNHNFTDNDKSKVKAGLCSKEQGQQPRMDM